MFAIIMRMCCSRFPLFRPKVTLMCCHINSRSIIHNHLRFASLVLPFLIYLRAFLSFLFFTFLLWLPVDFCIDFEEASNKRQWTRSCICRMYRIVFLCFWATGWCHTLGANSTLKWREIFQIYTKKIPFIKYQFWCSLRVKRFSLFFCV